MLRAIHLAYSKCHYNQYQNTSTIYLRAISHYSTASTSDAAYIIGGFYTSSIVAEFKDNQWRQLDNLNRPRMFHASLSVGDQTIIVGGYVENVL